MKKLKLFFFIGLALFFLTTQIYSAGNSPKNSDICKLIIESKMSESINFVIMGDGFTLNDMNSGFYDRKVSEFLDKFFFVPPFEQFKNYFNVYVVYSVSRDRGADDSPGKDTKNTVFNSTFGSYGIQRLIAVQDSSAVRQYVSYATDNPHNIIILINDERYGGAGGGKIISSHNKLVFRFGLP